MSISSTLTGLLQELQVSYLSLTMTEQKSLLAIGWAGEFVYTIQI